MSANVIIFDAGYILELSNKMNTACSLVDEAVANLKQASLHEGWKCKECTRISEELDDLNIRLGRLDEGVNETVRVLGGSVSRFAELEAKYENQANSLSDELTNNFGFSASSHQSSTPSTGSAMGASTTTAGGVAGVSAATGAGISAGVKPSETSGTPTPGQSMGGASIGMGMSNMNNNNMNNNQTLVNNNIINIPVTHIPDKPEAAAKGIKDTQEISNVAVDSVADSITQVLAGNVRVRVVAPDGSDRTAQNLVEAYNAGKTVADSSDIIISNPTVSHTEERLAMAAGLVTLAGSTVAGFGMLTSVSATATTTATATAGQFSPASISKNAQELLPSVQSVSDSNEISKVLNAISGNGVQETISSSEGSFLQKVLSALTGKINGQDQGSGISSTTSPIQEFFSSFVTDWE